MKKLFGVAATLAIVPVLLAAPALAEKPMTHQDNHRQPAATTNWKNWDNWSTWSWQNTQAQAGRQGQWTHDAVSDARINPEWVKGQWSLVSRQYPEAITAFQNILSKEPNNVHALEGLSTALYNQGRYDEAWTHISKAMQLDPVNPRLFYTKGMILDAQDKPMEAMEAYLTFTSLSPDDGAALMALRRVDELHRQVEPRMTEAWGNYIQGLRMLSMHQPNQAIGWFERFQTLEPTNAKANLWLGRAWSEWGQPEKAIPHYEKALKMNAENPWAYYQLGQSWEMTGDTQNATVAWRKFLQFAPQSEAAMTVTRWVESRQ